MSKINFTVFINILSLYNLNGQISGKENGIYSLDGAGKIVIVLDEGSEKSLQKIQSIEIKQKGFRVQVVSESGQGSKDRTLKVRQEIAKNFPIYTVYWIYESPYFKVKLGDFQTYIEAAALCEKIRVFYPSAYVVEDNISIYSPLKAKD